MGRDGASEDTDDRREERPEVLSVSHVESEVIEGMISASGKGVLCDLCETLYTTALT